MALGNLQMLLGNMGIPGGGVNPLRGQNNVQALATWSAPELFRIQTIKDEGEGRIQRGGETAGEVPLNSMPRPD